jgi:enediyne biosynthesis protein E4
VTAFAAVVLAQGALGADGSRGGGRVAVPRFVEESESAGVTHVYDGSWEFFVGGGVAAIDCDADALPDLYFAGGSAPAALFRNASPAGGGLRFERVTSPATDLDRVTGAYPLDIDSDGVLDLAVLRHGENVLLRGLGDCAFERANEAWGFDGGEAWTTSFSATWEDGQTWPTLAFGNYIDHVDEQGLTHCATNILVRPASSGEGFGPPTTLEPGACTLSMLFSDWDRSGRRDLRVSNDRHYYYDDGEEQLWRMPRDEEPRLYTRDEGWEQVQIWGMGIASQDLTDDGHPEVYLTNIGANRLETLAGDETAPSYEDIAFDRGISATTPWIGRPIHPSTSWHPEFDDVNNDGRLDLYVSKGNVDAIAENAAEDPSELFLGLANGRFRRAADRANIGEPTLRTRGASLVDLNADGLLDLVEVHRAENVSLRRNVGRGDAEDPRAMGHWLGVKLQQEGPNPDAIGAWVAVRAGRDRTEREVTVGGGHAGGELGPVHFGLGRRDAAEVRVTWPDGEQGPWQEVAADQTITIDREPAAP